MTHTPGPADFEIITGAIQGKPKMLDRPQRRYLQTPAVQARYGGVSKMWIYRKVRFDPAFPKPLVINQRHFFDEDELDNYDQQQKEKRYDAAYDDVMTHTPGPWIPVLATRAKVSLDEARVMDAAPELLAALKEVYTMLPVKGRKIVNAAIAKAEGE